MINYIKNLHGTSGARKIALTIIGILFGIVGGSFGIITCVGGCNGSDQIYFYIWEISVILIAINLIILGYRQSKELYLPMLIILLLYVLFYFLDHSNLI